MLTDEISKSIKRLKQLDKIELAEHDAELKIKNDREFSNLVNEFSLSLSKISFATKEMDFTISNEMIHLLSEVTDDLKNIITSGVVDEDELNITKKNVTRKVIPGLTKEWKEFYERKVSGINGKLSTIGSLVSDKDKISSIRMNISNGSDWSALLQKTNGGNTRIELFNNSILEIDEIEESLELSDEIKDFVMSVTRGRAKVTDISDSVVDWIKKENLEGRFVVKFRN